MGRQPALKSQAWPAPAKINRFLHIVGRREDGLHLLQTVFQFLDLGDRLCFAPREDGLITLTGHSPEVAPDDDLIVRAARLLQERSGVRRGADVRLEKRIPMGGGLGGGSSDAATTLRALSRLWGLGLTEDELAALGLELGADVPVFVRGFAAWAEGVGEVLTPIALDEPWFLVINPRCSVSTAAVFGHPKLTRNSPSITITGFRRGRVRNDCEPVVRELYPSVAFALDWLDTHAEARLTGTGGCLFAAFGEREAAEAVKALVPGQWESIVARGLNRSPLLQRLGAPP